MESSRSTERIEEVLTSTWSDGRGGPIAFCVPERVHFSGRAPQVQQGGGKLPILKEMTMI